jgi:hypothetical protein
VSLKTSRPYRIHVVTLDPNAAPYRWDRWRLAVPLLEPLFADKQTAVRSFQNDDGKNRPAKKGRFQVLGGFVRFGRLGWNDNSHQKWTHGSPTTGKASKAWHFFSTDFSLPSLNAFDRSGVPPNVFGKLCGSRRYYPPGTITVDATTPVLRSPASFFVAVALDDARAAKLEGAMRVLARTWNATMLCRGERTWAVDASKSLPLPKGLAVTGSMQDFGGGFESPEAARALGWEVLEA